jgi:hypothetical protein
MGLASLGAAWRKSITPVAGEFLLEGVELGLSGELAAMQEVDRFLVATILDQIVDMVAQIREAAVEAFDIGERGFVCGDSFETFSVIGHIVVLGGDAQMGGLAPREKSGLETTVQGGTDITFRKCEIRDWRSHQG